MKYFNSSLKLIVDASPVGLGAILTQVTADGGTNTVAYASRSLTDCKSLYSQTEREALAVVWGTECFHLYLCGSSFQIITDHKPLEAIFNNPTCKVTARLERLQLHLPPYKVNVVYKPGANNPTDYMSRHPDPKQSQTSHHFSRVDAYVNFHLYLCGSSFQIITDHKPLEAVFNNPTCKVTARLERLQLHLPPYKVSVVYKPGANNPTDYMNRYPDPKQLQVSHHLSRVDAYVNFVTNNAVSPAVMLQEVKDATAADGTLQSLARVIATQK